MGPHVRRKVVLFGASMTEYSFCHGGWGAALANLYRRKADIVLRGYRGWNTRGALEVLDKDAQEQPELVVVFFGANDAAFPMPSGRGQHVPLAEFEDNLCRIAAHLQVLDSVQKSDDSSNKVYSSRELIRIFFSLFEEGLSSKTRVILTTAPPISEASRLEHGRIKFGEKGAKYLDRSNGRAGEYAAACRAAAQKMGAGNIDLWTSIQRQPDWQITCLTDGLHLSALGSAVMLEELLKVLKDSTWQPSLHYATMSERLFGTLYLQLCASL